MTFNDLKFTDFIDMANKYIKPRMTMPLIKDVAKLIQQDYSIEDSKECLACALISTEFFNHKDVLRGLFITIDNRRNELARLND